LYFLKVLRVNEGTIYNQHDSKQAEVNIQFWLFSNGAKILEQKS